MIGDNKQRRNARWNYAEVIVTSAGLFVLYKFILMNLGIEAVGTWSIVAATTSLGRIADLGTAGGLGRFVAIEQADDTKDEESRREGTLIYIETALLFSAITFSCVGAILYRPALYALEATLPEGAIASITSLLPLSVISFVIVNISNVAAAALFGMQRSDLKSKISILATLFQLFVAFAMKDQMGLAGVALAQIVQNLIMLVGSWLIVQYLIRRRLSLQIPWRLRVAPLKDIAGLGIKLQFTAIVGFVSEPAMKYVLSIVGGLPALGTYELASKGVLLVRQVIIAPTPNLVPVFATLFVESPFRLATAYHAATAGLVVAGCAAMALVAFCAPLISVIWVGKMQANFVVYSVILAAGWTFNIISLPGFSLGIATGKLRWNLFGNIITLVMGTTLAFIAASILDNPVVVVAAYACSISAGALYSAYMNCRSANLALLPSWAEYQLAFCYLLSRLSRSRL